MAGEVHTASSKEAGSSNVGVADDVLFDTQAVTVHSHSHTTAHVPAEEDGGP